MSFDPAAAGWRPLAFNDGFAQLAGPFWMRKEEGGIRLGFIAERKHINMRGIVHGGMLMTFVDQAIGWAVQRSGAGGPSVTIQLDVNFVSAARLGDFVEGRGQVVRRTRSVVFAQGAIETGGTTVATGQGIWKILSKPPAL